MSLHIYNDKQQAAEGVAEWIAGNICVTLKDKDRYSFVLSGGNTPKLLYDILSKKYASIIEWHRVDFFWGDERFVPYEDDRNNAKMAKTHLLEPLKIPRDNIYMIPTDRTPQSAAVRYERTLKEYFKVLPAVFDLVLLGMGSDGHTLSLFPGSDLILYKGDDWVKDTVNQKEHLPRITLMPCLVNASENIVFLLNGEEKSKPLKEILKGTFDPEQFPAQLIQPIKRPASWFIDAPAASKL
ncbi:MAG: 6-phosphogluconolactonase [Chitinophagaceae bacterium]|nr:6-phosphogluconolactonase [Chitinophagaceae bacterium]